MTKEDLEKIANYLRKYARAVETSLYWKMSTSEAKKEITTAERLAGLVEAAAKTTQ